MMRITRHSRARAMASVATAALVAGLLTVTTAAPAGAATPSAAQQWTDVQALVDPINGVWTDQNYSGQLSDTMPDTALIGNGDVGVSSGGGSGFKTFNFGKNDFWRGNPGPGVAGIGSVSIRPTGSTTTGTFREEQDILRGDITTTMSLGGVPVTMRTWIAADSNLVVTQLTSNGGAVQVRTDTTAGTTQNQGGYTNTSGIVDQTAWATRATPSGSRWISRASLATRVIGATATGTSSGRTASLTFTLPAGGTVRIVTAVAGGGQNPADPASAAWTLAGNQTASGLDSLYAAHVEWWKQYWLKSYVDFNDSVLERYYYGHLYLIGSASRAGKMAPGLYGPWITTDSPQFSGDMHLNYNWVANFYGVYSSNRPELARPMFDLVTQYLPEARRRAQQDLTRVKSDYVSARFPSGGVSGGGVLFPVGIGPWGSTPDDNYHQQVGNSLFTVTQYLAYFDYTQDTSWLSSTGYPFMKEVGRFFEQYLEYDSGAGLYRLYTGPHEGTWARNSTADIGMLKSLFTALVANSTTLGVDSGLRANWSNIASRLPAPATTTNNGQTVYALGDPGTFVGSDTRAFHPGDNTVNLEFVHPGEALGLGSPQADLNRAITTLDQMNSWGQDNSFPKVFTQAARVGYPAASLISQVKTQINNKTAANLRIKDPNHGVEKAGAIEALNAMMLQTDTAGALRVFPVWPSGNNASFVKLRAEGALLVSSARSGGQVEYVDVTATNARTVKLVSPWSGTNVTVNRVGGGSTSYTVSGSTISFAAAAGATYTITFGGGGGGNGVTFYQDTNFGGTAVTLGVGTYSTAAMTAAGVPNNWVSSVRVPSGYTLTAYDGDLAGTSWVYTADNANFVTTGNNDLVSSFRITTGSGSTNLALGSVATASSAHSSFPPSRAVNGQWASGYEGWVSNVGKPQWIQLDLGTAKTFTRYVIRHDAAARPAETANTTKNWTLEVSSNGSSWTIVDTVTNNTAATTDRTIASQTFRYVRINISEPTQGTTSDSINNPRARIGQIELY